MENVLRRKRAEDRYRLLSHAVTSIGDSVYISDMRDNIVFVNKAFCETYGYAEEEVLGTPDDPAVARAWRIRLVEALTE